jgi:cytochrome c
MLYQSGRKIMSFHTQLSVNSMAAIAALFLGFAFAPPALASSQLALDKGCYSCHGTPPKKGTPTMEQLAADYAKYRGQTDAASRLAAKLREHHVFGGVQAHERLSEENAKILVDWLIDGAK